MIKDVPVKRLNRFVLAMTTIVLVNGTILEKGYAREDNLDILCQKFLLNSRCQGYKFSHEAKEAAIATGASQVIKLRLKTSGSDNEWIRIERSGNIVRLLHTTRAKKQFSRVINSLASAAPIPVPRIFNFYQWYDRQTTYIAFEPDIWKLLQQLKLSKTSVPQTRHTSDPSCTITGTDSVFLSARMDIRHGSFTIEYQEGGQLSSELRLKALEALYLNNTVIVRQKIKQRSPLQPSFNH